MDHENRSPDKPQWFRASEAKLAHEQRLLSHMKYGSKNYIRQLHKVQVLQEHIANQRKDFAHKESRRIANAYEAVCVEDLDMRAMAQSLNLGKSTNDNGFGMFREFLKYKLEEQGILGGLPVDGGILWCCTECNSKADMDRLLAVIGEVLGK